MDNLNSVFGRWHVVCEKFVAQQLHHNGRIWVKIGASFEVTKDFWESVFPLRL